MRQTSLYYSVCVNAAWRAFNDRGETPMNIIPHDTLGIIGIKLKKRARPFWPPQEPARGTGGRDHPKPTKIEMNERMIPRRPPVLESLPPVKIRGKSAFGTKTNLLLRMRVLYVAAAVHWH
jgi:hypothetical protein